MRARLRSEGPEQRQASLMQVDNDSQDSATPTSSVSPVSISRGRGRPPLSKASLLVLIEGQTHQQVKFMFPRAEDAEREKLELDSSLLARQSATNISAPPYRLKLGAFECQRLQQDALLGDKQMEAIVRDLKKRLEPIPSERFLQLLETKTQNFPPLQPLNRPETQASTTSGGVCRCTNSQKAVRTAVGLVLSQGLKPKQAALRTKANILDIYRLLRLVREDKQSSVSKRLCCCFQPQVDNRSLISSIQMQMRHRRPILSNIHELHGFIQTCNPPGAPELKRREVLEMVKTLGFKKKKVKQTLAGVVYGHSEVAKETVTNFLLRHHHYENNTVIFDVTSISAGNLFQSAWELPGQRPTIQIQRTSEYYHLYTLIDRDNIIALMLAKNSVTTEMTRNFLVASLKHVAGYRYLFLDNAPSNSVPLMSEIQSLYPISVVYNLPHNPAPNTIEWLFAALKKRMRSIQLRENQGPKAALEAALSTCLQKGIGRVSRAVLVRLLRSSTNFGAEVN